MRDRLLYRVLIVMLCVVAGLVPAQRSANANQGTTIGIADVAADGNGIMETLAGNGTALNSNDGADAVQAGLTPQNIAVAPDGTTFVSSVNQIRRINQDGTISTVAGAGMAGFSGDGGSARLAQFWGVEGLAVDATGNLFVADRFNQRVRRITPGGIVTTVAGTGTQGYNGDGGAATQAQLKDPRNVAIGPDGALYISDTGNHRIRRVANGTITTFAGNGVGPDNPTCSVINPGCGDGGQATQAEVPNPDGIAFGADSSLYIATSGPGRIRRVRPDKTDRKRVV